MTSSERTLNTILSTIYKKYPAVVSRGERITQLEHRLDEIERIAAARVKRNAKGE